MAIPSYVGFSSSTSGWSPSCSGSLRVLLESTPATAVRQRPRTCSRSASSGTSMDTDCSLFPSNWQLCFGLLRGFCHLLIRLIDEACPLKTAGCGDRDTAPAKRQPREMSYSSAPRNLDSRDGSRHLQNHRDAA